MRSALQRRLLGYFLLFSLLPPLIFLVSYLHQTQKQLEQQIYSERQVLLEHAVEKLENRITQVNEFISWTLSNETIQNLLTETPEQTEIYGEDNHRAAQILKEQFSYRPITRKMLSFIVLGDNGLDLRAGTEGYLLGRENTDAILADCRSLYGWEGIIDNPTRLTENAQVICYHRRILAENTKQPLGDLIILFSPDFIEDELSELLSISGGVRLCNADGGLLYQSNVQQTSTENRKILSADLRSMNWTLEQTLQGSVIRQQLGSLIGSMCLLVMAIVLLTALLSVFLSRNISAPIERLTAHIRRLSGGDFSHDSRIHRRNGEIDELDSRLQDMGDNIQMLMQQQEEKQKLELSLLQSQMNPHFLYNTLNSIRLMASLQGKNSIAEMIEALGKLLRANLAGSEELIPLGDELELLTSYLYIQNMRLKGKIRFASHIPEELESIPVLKFILQPLAENAILHGIGNRPIGGTITLRAVRENDTLLLEVQDDGCGMTPDAEARLRRKLKNSREGAVIPSVGVHGIALGNVQARIQMRWGADYGLTFETEEGRGTVMKIALPILGQNKESE